MSDPSLDIEQPAALDDYLRRTRRIDANEAVSISVLAGGVSNRTVLVRRPSGEAWVLKQALAKLRVAVDWFSDPSRIEREALGIRRLGELLPSGCVPPLIFEDSRHFLLAMSAVPEPHRNLKAVLLSGAFDMELVGGFGFLLGMLHARSWRARQQLSREFADRQFFESLRLEPYYLYSADQVPEAAFFLRELIASTRSRRLTLVHGDYSPKNILVAGLPHAQKLVLLDHEVIHWGDPAFDLGFALAHLLSKAHHLRAHRQQLAQSASLFWSRYASANETPQESWESPSDLEAHAVRHALGCLLARVAGRSPLEYLSESQRLRQRQAVARLMADPPIGVLSLIERFLRMVSVGEESQAQPR